MGKSHQYLLRYTPYLEETKIRLTNMEVMSKGELKKQIQEGDQKKWEDELQQKTSLALYRRYKKEIKEENVYDNTGASICLYQARSNTLRLNSRQFDKDKNEKCDLCGKEQEDIGHFILRCEKLQDIRSKIEILQQPYIEDETKVLGRVPVQHK